MAFVGMLMFQPIAFHLHTTDPEQRNVSAPWLIQNVPTISEALQAGSLHLWQEQPTFLDWHSGKLQGCGSGEAPQTPLPCKHSLTAILPQGPIELEQEDQSCCDLTKKRHWVYNLTLQFWQISPLIIQYKILQPDQATQFDQDRCGIQVLS